MVSISLQGSGELAVMAGCSQDGLIFTLALTLILPPIVCSPQVC